MIESTVIADSINSKGVRLTSLQLTYPRFILAELNTHRAFSRSTSSSRAIPVARLIERVQTEPATPIHWGQNQRGMQADKEIEDPEIAVRLWHEAASRAVAVARKMEAEGVHKQVVNRILEPFVHASTIVTATDWHNFFILRDHEDAQPEIRELARAMATAMDKSKPTRLSSNQWHLPYVTDHEKRVFENSEKQFLLPIMSAARCARVSYMRHDGQKPLIEDDTRLFEQLAISAPAHCYDESTEVLTGRGFVPWPEVTKNDLFACVDSQTGVYIGMNEPISLVKHEYAGKFYEYQGKSVSLRVTDGHSLYAHPVAVETDRYSDIAPKLIPANQPSSSKRKFKTIGETEMRMLACAKPGDHEKNYEYFWGQFCGFFVGDGCANKETRNHIYFNLKKDRKISYLREVANKLNLEISNGSSWKITAPDISRIFRDFFYTEEGEKTFPDYFFSLSHSFAQGFFDGLKNSDGSLKRNTWIYCTASETLAEKLIAYGACFGVSFTPSVTEHPDSNSKRVFRLNSSSPLIRVNDPRKSSERVRIAESTETVYCAEVPGHVLIVRRNGRVLLSGNCSPLEHQARPLGNPFKTRCRNFRGWEQFRHIFETKGWHNYDAVGEVND